MISMWYRLSYGRRSFHWLDSNGKPLCRAYFNRRTMVEPHRNDEHPQNCRTCLSIKTRALIAAALPDSGV